jgi:hypothetical protein
MISKHQKLIELIRPHSINNPTTDEALLKDTGFTTAELKAVLDKMAHQLPGLIGRCEVIKDGKSLVQVWPSAAFNRVNPDELKGTKSQSEAHKLPGIVRRETQRKEPAMAQDKVIRNVDIVRHVSKNPGSSRTEVINALSGDDKKEQNTTGVKIAQCLKQRYLAFDGNGSLILGDNEEWLAQHDLLETKTLNGHLAKIESITAEGPATAAAIQELQPTTDVVTLSAPIHPADPIEPPTEVAHEPQTAVGQASLVGSALADVMEDIVYDPDIKNAEQMTVAYVSDGTLHLIGIHEKPIVLNVAQTGILKSFMTKCRLVG